ncbi:MAG: EI24 domain-containing protein [Sphingomonadaceae bacterium]|nr:EI24 domain-containing protein [Sphingomonadaceae bacterium]
MIQAVAMAFQSLADARVQRLLVRVILLTLLSFLILGFSLWWAMSWGLGWIGLEEIGVSADNASVFGAFLAAAMTLLSTFLLFRIVAVAITWVFADDIIDAVEDRHYPKHAMTGKRPGLVSGTAMALRSVARVVGYNLLALPVYLLLLVTGVGTAIAFLLVNALLLGRDLEDMLVARHGKEHGTMRKLPRLLLGLTGTVGMMVPFFNLIVPVLATATAVHMVHSGVSRL